MSHHFSILVDCVRPNNPTSFPCQPVAMLTAMYVWTEIRLRLLELWGVY
jgi:hypothetical protein